MWFRESWVDEINDCPVEGSDAMLLQGAIWNENGDWVLQYDADVLEVVNLEYFG